MVVPVLLSPRSAAKRVTRNTARFNKLIWTILAQVALQRCDVRSDPAAFANPDHVGIVIHNYRWRLGLAKGEAKYDDLEDRLFQGPAISVSTITISSDFDGPAKSGTATAASIRASTSTEFSSMASAMTCRRKRPRRSDGRRRRQRLLTVLPASGRHAITDLPGQPRLGFPHERIGEEGEAVTERPGVEEPHGFAVAVFPEQAMAGAEHDRMPSAAARRPGRAPQRVDELAAAVDEDVAVHLLPEHRHLLHHVTGEHLRVVPPGLL